MLKNHGNGFLRESKEDKIDFTLIPIEVLTALAKHYTVGAKIHGRDNWKKSRDVNTFKQSAYRHLIEVLQDNQDEDHISALIWNVACLKWHKMNG